MARTESRMVELGTQMPEFRLKSTNHQQVSSQDLSGKAYLICFICNHCPYVVHISSQLAVLGRDLAEQGVTVVGINPNDTDAYPADNFEAMIAEVELRGYSFPYLLDADQSVARAFGAECTPDFFLFDSDRKLYYRGQLDGSRPGNDAACDGKDLRAACNDLLKGSSAPESQMPSVGCGIKWRPNG